MFKIAVYLCTERHQGCTSMILHMPEVKCSAGHRYCHCAPAHMSTPQSVHQRAKDRTRPVQDGLSQTCVDACRSPVGSRTSSFLANHQRFCRAQPRSITRTPSRQPGAIACNRTVEADVAVVGGGIIGLWVALQLLHHPSQPSVALVERQLPCSGATGAGSITLTNNNLQQSLAKPDMCCMSRAYGFALCNSQHCITTAL